MSQVFDLSIDILDYDFSRDSLSKLSQNYWVKNQWPVVYFIQNEKQKIAYVGESTNASSRIGNHLDNEIRSILNKVSVIGSDKFNKSATLDIEAQLIQYISSEGTYTLQNGNNGLSFHNYYQQHLYSDLFKEVWTKLIEKKIVNKSLEEIQNSDFFKYSPYKSLNRDQLNSVLEIIESLNKKEAKQIFVRGSAGTGKTILATYLIKLLTSKPDELNLDDIDNENLREIELLNDFQKKYPNLTIGLVISMSSLRQTLQNVFQKIRGLTGKMVISPTESFNKKYDILIVDEAHRLRQRKNISWMGVFTQNNNKLGLGNEGTELDWVLANSKHQIFFYDESQSVKPSDVPKERFDLLLKKSSTIKLKLKSQMRVKAGSDYITFVDNLLNCRTSKLNSKYEPLDYELRFFESLNDLYDELAKKEAAYKLCRLVAGYSWPWETNKTPRTQDYDIEIDGLKFCWNKTDKDWIGSTNSFQEIGCIHTTQGYDLNYVGVIFGKEIKYNPELEKIEIIPQNYFDRNGKAGITDINDLKEYIINIYKTIMYRGIRGTYLYACDKHLREYLQKWIPATKQKESFKILHIEDGELPSNTVPFYDVSVAAGEFSESLQNSAGQFIELPESYKNKKEYFVCKVVGDSMNKVIPNGSFCLFEKYTGGSRQGKIVLVQNRDIQDSDFGLGYTVKQYFSKKNMTEEGWSHEAISLKPMSNLPRFKDIILESDEISELNVVGVFIAVLN